MKKIILILLLLIPSIAFSQGELGKDWTGGLPLGNDAYLSAKSANNQSLVQILKVDGSGVVRYGSSGVPVVPNDTFLKGRNAADSADLNVLKVDTSNRTVLDTAGSMLFYVDGTLEAQLANNALNTYDTSFDINVNSAAGSLYVRGVALDLLTPGATLSIQESTAGSKCMGSVTFNGTTAVTTATTCAVTGARIFLTPTSDPTGSTAAYCWVTNIVNGVSFDVDCDQANDGTANWFIIKEAP